MKTLHIATLFASLCLALPVSANIVTKAQTEQTELKSHNAERERRFQQLEQQLFEQKRQLIAEKQSLKAKNDQLSQSFTQNEQQLAELENTLRLESGSLGEVFSVARQSANSLTEQLESSISGAGAQASLQSLTPIVEQQQVPNTQQLTALWRALENEVALSGSTSVHQLNYVDGEGKISQQPLLRLGSIALIGKEGFAKWNGSSHQASTYIKQPDNAPTLDQFSASISAELTEIELDPTRGNVLEQYASQPSLVNRIEAGGLVGGVIIFLLIVGLLIALVRGVAVLSVSRNVKAQLKTPETPKDNPLGRVLAVYSDSKAQTVEALELRLLEVILDEQAKLEKGLSMLKLLAALAPMLGLLGTVTGMIETFQVITLFGTGDAKVMAGGISTALVTTVMGLVAAMPLLLAHNLLSTQAENLRNILEKQGIALVAELAEKNTSEPVVESV